MNYTPQLTIKQRLFCERYLTNGYNATQAARDSGYSLRSAAEIGNENLRKPQIKQYLEVRMKEAAAKLGITPEYLLSKLKDGIELSIPDANDGDTVEEIKLKLEHMDIRAGVACIAETNKMLGNYEPEKQEITHGIDKLDELVEKYKKEF